MTSQEKKEILLQYRRVGREVQDLETEIQRWRSRAEQMTAGYGPTPSGGVDGRSLEHTVAHIDDLTRQLAQRLDRLVTLRQEIGTAIDGVPDPKQRELLQLRYIKGLTWEKLATAMGYHDFRWIYRLHGRALESLTLENQS